MIQQGRLRPFEKEAVTAARRAAADAILRMQREHRATGGNTKDFRLRVRCEKEALDILLAHNVPLSFRVSEDRKTSSIGSFFALSSCQPTANCLKWCYILGNPVTGPNSPFAIVKAVENSYVATERPDIALDVILGAARRQTAATGKQVSIRISNGGEIPTRFLELIMKAVPTRMLFSVDDSSRVLPDGLQDSDIAYTVAHGSQARPNVTVNFPMHGVGAHWTPESVKALGEGMICPAITDTLQNSPCGTTCFQCFPAEAQEVENNPIVAWGFTKRRDVWQTYSNVRIVAKKG